ncbi:MAG TPA: rhombotarget lipoprotein [Candidatus Polarisedimenticolia bacterium]|nr:rhombotarget lipoprotein [Candidatus Polarisedimenticolia bacterium]
MNVTKPESKPRKATATLLAVSMLGGLAACATARNAQVRSSALEYLYPRGAEAVPPADVKLRTPVRVGLAFSPAPKFASGQSFTANQKQALLERVAAAFRGKEGIGTVEVIPAGHLTAPVPPYPGETLNAASTTSGFEELDRIKSAYGVDLMALVSYDQTQFSGTGRSAWAYWTIVGLYTVKGEKNDTETMLDAVVYDIASRALLFNATGQSRIEGGATPVDIERVLRQASIDGFDRAADDLIAKLGTALDAFQKQAATGSVRGPGTPAIALYDAKGNPLPAPGSDGSGRLGAIEAAGIALLAWLALRRG